MLSRQEHTLIRAALAYWSEEMMQHSLPCDADTETALRVGQRIEPNAMDHLYNRLGLQNVNYVVVDTLVDHVVNTRLFKHPPKLYPANSRWQVRSVIG